MGAGLRQLLFYNEGDKLPGRSLSRPFRVIQGPHGRCCLQVYNGRKIGSFKERDMLHDIAPAAYNNDISFRAPVLEDKIIIYRGKQVLAFVEGDTMRAPLFLISSMRANLRRYVRSICSRWARMSISWRKFPMKRSMPCSHVNRMMPLLKWTDGPSTLCRSLSSTIRNGSALRSWWGMSTGTGTNHRSTVDAVVLRPGMTA